MRTGRVTAKEMPALLRQSRARHSPLFTLRVAPLSLGTPSKAAIVVSKQVAKKAVDRNRLKRQGRELLRLESKTLRSPLAMILIYKKTKKLPRFSALKDEISIALLPFKK